MPQDKVSAAGDSQRAAKVPPQKKTKKGASDQIRTSVAIGMACFGRCPEIQCTTSSSCLGAQRHKHGPLVGLPSGVYHWRYLFGQELSLVLRIACPVGGLALAAQWTSDSMHAQSVLILVFSGVARRAADTTRVKRSSIVWCRHALGRRPVRGQSSWLRVGAWACVWRALHMPCSVVLGVRVICSATRAPTNLDSLARRPPAVIKSSGARRSQRLTTPVVVVLWVGAYTDHCAGKAMYWLRS